MILATLDLSSGDWTIEDDSNSSYVAVGFSSDGGPATFDNLSFGWTVSVNGEEVSSKSYPEGDIVYVSTDQTYLSMDAIDVSPDDDCVLSVWAENSGEKNETSYEWTVARPDSPHPSWIWNSEIRGWEAPIPMPQDGKTYRWDEDTTSWVASESVI